MVAAAAAAVSPTVAAAAVPAAPTGAVDAVPTADVAAGIIFSRGDVAAVTWLWAKYSAVITVTKTIFFLHVVSVAKRLPTDCLVFFCINKTSP
jgi:hypothetical protein